MKTGVKFLFGGSLFFIAVMEKYQALKLIREWRDGKEMPKRLGDTDGTWAIETASITGMHTVEFSDQPTPTEGALPLTNPNNPFFSRGSGL